jgi:hypothetical protein
MGGPPTLYECPSRSARSGQPAGWVGTGTATFFAVPFQKNGRARFNGTTLCQCSFGKVLGSLSGLGYAPQTVGSAAVGRESARWSGRGFHQSVEPPPTGRALLPGGRRVVDDAKRSRMRKKTVCPAIPAKLNRTCNPAAPKRMILRGVFIDMAKNPTLRIQLIGTSKLAQSLSLRPCQNRG